MSGESTTTKPGGAGDGEGKTEGESARIAELSKESASYRVQRNEAVRRSHAYETILKAHGVDLAGVTAESLAALPISEGKVDGQFKYTPPKIEVPKRTDPAKPADGGTQLTLDEVKTWSADKINANWDKVRALMAKEK